MTSEISSELSSHQARIAYRGSLKRLLRAILAEYKLGDYVGHEIKLNGYEDFNLTCQTSSGTVFIKCFADFRTYEECERYVTMMGHLSDKGVQCPPLFRNKSGRTLTTIVVGAATVRVALMQYLDGGNIWESGRKLALNEQAEVIGQAAAINKVGYRPEFIYDSWAIVNLPRKYQENHELVDLRDRPAVEKLIDEFQQIDLQSLPHAFVHGDIRETNIMRHSDHKTYLIDFSCANWYPRLVELAVICADVLFDPEQPGRSAEQFSWGVREYIQAGGMLTQRELQLLPLFIQLAHATDLVGGSSADATDYISKAETKHWLMRGKMGLQHFPKAWRLQSG